MPYDSPKNQDYLNIPSIGMSIARILKADEKQTNQLTRVDHLWKHYKTILGWDIANTYKWLIGGSPSLILREEDPDTGKTTESINTDTRNISFTNVTGYVYLAKLLIQYPGFKNYLTKYVSKGGSTKASDLNHPTDNCKQVPAETGSNPMPDMYYRLWEWTGDESYLRYLQSILYILNRLGAANLDNDRDNLEPDDMDKSGKKPPNEQYCDNVVAYCLLVIEKFENRDFILNRRYKFHRKLSLNLGFGKYRDHYLEQYSKLHTFDNQALALLGFLNSSLHLTTWQMKRLKALSKKHLQRRNSIRNRIYRAKRSTDDSKRMDLIEDLETALSEYAILFDPASVITRNEYDKLRSVSAKLAQMLEQLEVEDNNT